VLNSSPRSRWRQGLGGLLAGCLALLMGAGLVALGLPLLRFQEGNPALANRPWGMWALELWLVMVLLVGLVYILVGGSIRWWRPSPAREEDKPDWKQLVYFGFLAVVGCLLGFALTRDRSPWGARLWVEMAAFAGAVVLLLCGGVLLLMAPVGAVAFFGFPFRIILDVRREWVRVDQGLDFPNCVCAIKDIVAVQVLSGTWREDGQPGPGFQVNLVLGDVNKPRVSLCEYSDLTAARDVGRSLADFLHVRLVEQVLPAA
jgi:hypothetical protein